MFVTQVSVAQLLLDRILAMAFLTRQILKPASSLAS